MPLIKGMSLKAFEAELRDWCVELGEEHGMLTAACPDTVPLPILSTLHDYALAFYIDLQVTFDDETASQWVERVNAALHAPLH